jgi:hypothetical protein
VGGAPQRGSRSPKRRKPRGGTKGSNPGRLPARLAFSGIRGGREHRDRMALHQRTKRPRRGTHSRVGSAWRRCDRGTLHANRYGCGAERQTPAAAPRSRSKSHPRRGSRIGRIYRPVQPTVPGRYASGRDSQLVPVLGNGPNDFENAFAAMAKAEAQAAIVQGLFDPHRKIIIVLAAKHRLPVMSGNRETAAAGASSLIRPSSQRSTSGLRSMSIRSSRVPKSPIFR